MNVLHTKPYRSILFATLFAASAAAPFMATAQDAPAAASTATTPSDADLAATQCAIGEEQFLPGDYFYCLAKQSYGKQQYAYARKFFETAAGWASKPAQYVLGVMALNGDHQAINRPLALAWMTLAAERPNSDFKPAYQAVHDGATAAERKAAEKLLASMRPVYADATAATRAEQRYTQGMNALNRKNAGGSNYCIAGMATLAKPIGDPTQCPPIQIMAKAIDRAAASVFDGWSGHVTVEPLQPVEAPAAGK
jgi:hypothetical protein